ncbi:MAG: APC family permease [Ruminococcaceae bacterium]|nr:APC family permease [Oscillospiraceae bacterium]
MTLCYFLKLLSELSLLFVVADCFLSVAAVGVESLIPAVFFAAVGAAAYWMDEKHSNKTKFLLPLLLIPMFLFGESFGTYLAIGLGALYVGLMIWQKRYYMDHDSQSDFFRIGMFAVGALSVPFVLLMKMDFIAPFVLLYLMSGIFMLRLMRQDAAIFNETRFRVLNLLSVAGIVLLAVLISSDWFLGLAGMILGKIYDALVIPIFYVIYACGYALYYLFIEIIFAGGYGDTTKKLNFGDMSMPDEMKDALLGEEQVNGEPFLMLLKGIFLIVGILLVLLLVYRNSKSRNSRSKDRAREARTSVTMIRPEEKIYADHIAPREPRAAVRYHYRNFLRLCLSLGQEFPRHYTSQHIENMTIGNFDKETLKSMRKTYIRARYSEHDITKDDVSSIKAQVKKLKSEAKVDGIRVDDMHDKLRDNRVLNGSWMTVGRGPEGNMHYNKKL